MKVEPIHYGEVTLPAPTCPVETGDWRPLIVEEARRWIGTPFLHQGDIRGVGVDCIFLLIRTFHACGRIPDIDPRPYPHAFFMRDRRFIEQMKPYARVLAASEAIEPADMALFRLDRNPCHGSIVSKWPRVIHADPEDGVVEVDYRETGMRHLTTLRMK